MESLEDRIWETVFKDGQRLLRDGKHDQALKEFKAALNISHKFDKKDPRRAQSLNGLALAHTVRQEFADAEPLFREAADLIQKVQGDDDIELARVLKHLAMVCNSQFKFEPAEEAYQRALGIYEKIAPGHPDVATVKQQLGRIQKRVGAEKGRWSLDEGVPLQKSKPGTTPSPEKTGGSDGPSIAGGPVKTDSAGKPPSGTTIRSLADIASSQPENLVGHVLDDRFQVVERVAAGGMSVIYKARHALLDRMVAIKVMHPHLVSNQRNMKRFQQEARTASGLTHPNIVTVRDFGVTKEGLCFIVMDFVEGETLANRINREHHLSPEVFIPICKQIVEALAHAHESNVLHRDLKPSNIMLQKQGDHDIAKLVDFGIAKVVSKDEESLSLTATGETVGSPLYMSPEQCRGVEVDHRSDIYSLGCLAYKSLTGFPPFLGGSDIDVYFKHINESAPPFAAAAPEIKVPQLLEAIVIQALQKSPENRQQSMEEVKHQLDKLDQ